MKKRVLIVSHNQVERDLIFNLLNKFGYEILSATDGEEGLAIACSEKPDLIIIDVLIPKKNGFAACKELKSSPELAQIPVILLTGSRNDSEEDCWGADMYLSTPVEQRDLLKAVFYYLSKHLLLRYEREERRQQRRTIREDASFSWQGLFV